MLQRIKLTNFRRHRSLDVSFGAGLSVIRALNEQGKSTLLEAISYACFGVKAIRNSLEDCVTWGEATNTLKVELDIAVDGVVYNVRRGKSGAEVNYDGGTVTGQNEVTAFIARLLKMDAGAAARLTLSNQNEIRGALSAGAKETTALIERLAEFSQIDDLLELMQEKLSLGSTATIEAGIKSAEEDLERARAAIVPVNEKALELDITLADDAHQRAKVAHLQAQTEADAANEAYSAARLKVQARQDLVDRVSRAERRRDKASDELRAVGAVPGAPTDEEIAAVEQQVAHAELAESNVAVYLRVQDLFLPPKDFVDGTADSLADSITDVRKVIRDAETAAAKLRGDIRVLEQQLLQGLCSFCGKDFSGVPEVEAKNAQIRAEIAEKTAAEATLVRSVVGSNTEHLNHMEEIQQASKSPNDWLARFPNLLEQVGCTQPPQLRWIGPKVADEPADVEGLRSKVATMRKQQRDAAAASASHAAATKALKDAQTELDALLAELAATPEVDASSALEALQAARQAVNEAGDVRTAAQTRLQSLKQGLEVAKSNYERAVATAHDAESRLTQLRASLADVEFNNVLLKRVRQVRPLIADKLWNIVLAAVSGYFSEIRGERSKVTKGSDGFEVDGHPISSLSGSTLDALGLAIRVALVRTFLPSAPFLILDEPAAAMDEDRTNNLLGFISASGFQQILLVTHEDVSQSVADHVITL